jgi:hypothetical protein
MKKKWYVEPFSPLRISYVQRLLDRQAGLLGINQTHIYSPQHYCINYNRSLCCTKGVVTAPGMSPGSSV